MFTDVGELGSMSSPIRSQAIPQPRVLPCGDTAISFEFGDRIDCDLSMTAVILSRRIDAAGLEGVIETVPTYRSVLVHYSPLETSSSADLVSRILSLADSGGAEHDRLAVAVARGEFDLPSEPAMPHEPSSPPGAAETTP